MWSTNILFIQCTLIQWDNKIQLWSIFVCSVYCKWYFVCLQLSVHCLLYKHRLTIWYYVSFLNYEAFYRFKSSTNLSNRWIHWQIFYCLDIDCVISFIVYQNARWLGRGQFFSSFLYYCLFLPKHHIVTIA